MKNLFLFFIIIFILVSSSFCQVLNITLTNPGIQGNIFKFDVIANIYPGQRWRIGSSNIRVAFYTTPPNSAPVRAETGNNVLSCLSSSGYSVTITSINGGTASSFNITRLGLCCVLNPGTYKLGELRYNILNPNGCITDSIFPSSVILDSITPLVWTKTDPPPCVPLHYDTISGTIRFQDNNQIVSGGCVKAIRLDQGTNQIITVDSTEIQSNGSYSLQHIPLDSIYIMAFEDDEAPLSFVPTYYPSSINWQNATVLYPTGNLSNINILVYRINGAGGSYHIGGTIYLGSQNPLTGLYGAVVYAKVGNDFKSYSVSSGTGSYQIDSLASNSFNVMVDRLGYAPLNRSVVIISYSKDTIDFALTPVGIEKAGFDIPKNYWLGNNYPNPFNPTTTIKFGVPKTSLVKIIIYDILGREVTTIVNEQFHAGNYSISWDASKYASGVYFYKIQANDFVETKKLVVLK